MYDFTLKGLLNANIDTVYNAFIDPDVFVKWFAPGNLVVSQFISHFAEGGNYRAVLQSPDRFQQTVVGTYQEIKHNSHLSFTWRWDDTNDITKVNVVFISLPNLSTQITLTQSGFDREKDMIHQQYNWLDCLEKLSLATWDAGIDNQPLVA
jgi:uncharacterized protein YndB with AHSA1/START domain